MNSSLTCFRQTIRQDSSDLALPPETKARSQRMSAGAGTSSGRSLKRGRQKEILGQLQGREQPEAWKRPLSLLPQCPGQGEGSILARPRALRILLVSQKSRKGPQTTIF